MPPNHARRGRESNPRTFLCKWGATGPFSDNFLTNFGGWVVIGVGGLWGLRVKDEYRLLDEAEGYRELGLYPEAMEVLARIPTEAGKAWRDAQAETARIQWRRGRWRESIDVGRRALRPGREGDWTSGSASFLIALSLHTLGCYEEEKQMIEEVRCSDEFASAGDCELFRVEARLGDPEAALTHVRAALAYKYTDAGRLFSDSDFACLLNQLAQKPMPRKAAHLLHGAPFSEALDPPEPNFACLELRPFDVDGFIPGWRDVVRMDPVSGMLFPDLVRARQAPEEFAMLITQLRFAWHSVKVKFGFVLRRAENVVIEAQADYAAQQLQARNHFAARLHLTYALSRRPSLLASYRGRSELEPLAYFLDEVEVILEHDAAYLTQMENLRGKGDAEWQILAAAPEQVRKLDFWKLRWAGALMDGRDFDLALELFLEVAERWPLDLSPFGNAALCCVRLKRWREAAFILSRAPGAYANSRHCAEIREAVRQRNAAPAFAWEGDFAGGPDWGWMLNPASQSDAEQESAQ